MLQRVKEVQESDLRMDGALARNIQRVIAVTQADIDAAAAQGRAWVVKPVIKVSDPLDNLRGGTQLVIKQNSILPGQNVMRVMYVGGTAVVVGPAVSPLALDDAIADSLAYVKAYGGTEQRNIPQPYTQVNYVTNTAQTAINTGIMIDFAKNYEFEVECRAVSGSWYILQSRASSSGNITGIHGATSGSTITLVVGNVTVCTSAITRTAGNKLYVKATLNAGTATLYVKDETANTEDTQTDSYGTTQPNPTAAVYLLGNAGEQYVDVNSDIYMARIKENDTVVMDYVPARQGSTAGFYDKASGTFKTALTPANLVADGNTVPTPDAPMDIVSNNGVLKVNSQGQIYADGTVETINVHGKNLFDVSANPLEQGGITSNDGQNTATSYNQRARTNGYIPVKPSTVYTASVKDLQIYYLEYAQDKTYTDRHASGFADNSVTFTTGANTYFIRLQFRKSGNSDIMPSEVTNVQLERGSTATEYEPYYNGGTATAETLLKVGDYQDVQSILDGVVTRNVGATVLDGTEDWVDQLTSANKRVNLVIEDIMNNNAAPLLVTHGAWSLSGSAGSNVWRILTGRYISCRTSEPTLADFKTYLAAQYAAGTPVIVVYPLATPTTETVTGQTLQVTDGDNIVEITQAGMAGLELEVEYVKQ